MPMSKIYEQTTLIDSIKTIDKIPVEKARELFCRNPTDLGIWHCFPGKKFKRSWDPYKLRGFSDSEKCQKLIDFIVSHDNFKNHVIVNQPLKNYCVCYSHMNGISKSHNFVYYNNIAPDGKTYKEHIVNQHKNEFPRTHFRFDTFEEADNFRKYCNSEFFKKIKLLTQPGLLRVFELLPWLPDWSHEWTEKELRSYFNAN